MKGIVALLFAMLLLTGCGSNEGKISETVVTEPMPTAEETQEVWQQEFLSHELAMIQGYVVMDEGDVRHNAGNWVNFLKTCENGEQAAVTVVQFQLEETGYTYVEYDLSFDGETYSVEYVKDGTLISDSASELVYTAGKADDTMEPYDSFERYCLNDLVIYEDLIAETDFEGVHEIFLHAKEGEPAIQSYTGDTMQPVLELLWNAKYVPCEPENYVYGIKLLMTNRDGKELVIELDLNQGYYRYGMQNYKYGEVADMLAALGINQWPDSVLNEFGELVN